MHDFTQEICQRCESDYATRKSPYCPRCNQLHQEAEELTDDIMACGQAWERYRAKPVSRQELNQKLEGL